jgi:hypothetical protein
VAGWWPSQGRMMAMSRPYDGHMEAVWRSYRGRVEAIWRPCRGRMEGGANFLISPMFSTKVYYVMCEINAWFDKSLRGVVSPRLLD